MPYDLTKKCKEMCEKASLDCEQASEEQLVEWAATDSLMALFAQKELVYRNQQQDINTLEVSNG